jgi:lipopolysaccharide/colanic/teichoic acid biosynthesis glycosyltransferase/carbonic anhydrase/acetyltransferase-like protein (isoleucine patch superfamily)
MRLVVIQQSKSGEAAGDVGLLRYALTTRPLAEVVTRGADLLWQRSSGTGDLTPFVGTAASGTARWVVPAEWRTEVTADIAFSASEDLQAELAGSSGQRRRGRWMVLSSGRFVTHLNGGLLAQVLARTSADAVAVAARPDLQAYHERIRLTGRGELVGYRRLYRDCVEPMPTPADWPHHLLVRDRAIEPLLADGMPRDFSTWLERCREGGLTIQAVAIGGLALDVESEAGLMTLCRSVLAHASQCRMKTGVVDGTLVSSDRPAPGVSPAARFVGPVLLGEGVLVEPNAVVIGPAVLCDHSVIRSGAIVDSCIVGAEASVESSQVVTQAVVANGTLRDASAAMARRPLALPRESAYDGDKAAFCAWPRFSYAGWPKRVADVVAATVVLILFAPIIPFIALAIKINSPGSVFYADKRQGLHGKRFNCLKFRTMRVDAAEMQDKLRFVSEVDGPQFKMADDPRISAVGRFLRETYLDEIPQFFNVLCGQMSVVGPRPSPESENTLCPSWRDARLSVRPGITGLWQVRRTREPLRDFQEWIYYDTQYIKDLSLKTDLWICWKTFTRMLHNFARQF